MKTQKNYQYRMQEGDSCEVRQKRTKEQSLIEDHPQALLENQYVEEEPIVAAPVRKHTNWMAWCFVALAAILAIWGIAYLANRDDEYATKKRMVYVIQKPAKSLATANVVAMKGAGAANGAAYNSNLSGNGAAANGVNGSGVNGNGAAANGGAYSAAAGAGNSAYVDANGKDVVNYVYYFGNNQSAVTSNKVLDNVAAQVENANADVVITAYASEVGNPAYNKNLSTQRAENVADYLVAHGVPRNHVKIVSEGESTQFGDDAHNRRAEIHVVYNG